MSLAINIYKKQRNNLLVLVKNKDGIMKFTCLKNRLSLSSEEAEKPPR